MKLVRRHGNKNVSVLIEIKNVYGNSTISQLTCVISLKVHLGGDKLSEYVNSYKEDQVVMCIH